MMTNDEPTPSPGPQAPEPVEPAVDHDPGAADDAGLEPTAADRVAELEQQVAELKDKWLRALADHDNYRKRTRRELEEATVRGQSQILEDILPVFDNLERALEALGPDDSGPIAAGLRMVKSSFLGVLAKHGITAVDSVGQPFDPTVHDALSQVVSDAHEPGTVIQELERAYLRGDRLIRPARVVIAAAGSGGGGQAGAGQAEAGPRDEEA